MKLRLALTLLAATLQFLPLSAQTEGNDAVLSKHRIEKADFDGAMLIDSLRLHNMEVIAPTLTPQQDPFQNHFDRTVTLPSLSMSMPSASLWKGAGVSAYGQHQRMAGLMDVSSGAVTFHQDLGRFHFSASAIANKYWMPFQHDMQTQFGIGGTLSYSVSDAVSLHAFGYYYATNPIVSPAFSPNIGTTSYGGYADVRFNEHWGTSLGVRRYVNPMSGRWTTESAESRHLGRQR